MSTSLHPTKVWIPPRKCYINAKCYDEIGSQCGIVDNINTLGKAHYPLWLIARVNLTLSIKKSQKKLLFCIASHVSDPVPKIKPPRSHSQPVLLFCCAALLLPPIPTCRTLFHIPGSQRTTALQNGWRESLHKD